MARSRAWRRKQRQKRIRKAERIYGEWFGASPEDCRKLADNMQYKTFYSREEDSAYYRQDVAAEINEAEQIEEFFEEEHCEY